MVELRDSDPCLLEELSPAEWCSAVAGIVFDET
jgi:hypothetical protein